MTRLELWPVNTLAVAAKDSQEAVCQLWFEVEGFIAKICNRYSTYSASGTLDFEDYFHSAYFGFVKAVEAYNPERGSFTTILSFYIENSCRLELHAARKNCHISLDAPHGEDEGATLLNLLPDQCSDDQFEKISIQNIAQIILKEADRIPSPIQTRIIRECTYGGRPLTSLADELDISAQAVSQCH